MHLWRIWAAKTLTLMKVPRLSRRSAAEQRVVSPLGARCPPDAGANARAAPLMLVLQLHPETETAILP